MASRKRTIRVVLVESDVADSGRPQKRAAISIDAAATNAELAREIAETFNQSAGITLEIDGGFVLREKDTVDVIGDKDVVSAIVAAPTAEHQPPPASGPVPVFPSLKPERKDVDDAVDRYKIGFITAEKALAHAKDTPREQSEATNGVFAFDGEMVSGSTTLRDLEREAARVLRWSSPNDAGMDVDDQPCNHDDKELACSCPVAREIELHGVSDTLHCRFTIDGSMCMKDDCPYSHCQLADPSAAAPPHCSLCEEALGFPCPKCLARARSEGKDPGSVIFCPLVQNAGCGHLHHAHCVRPRYDLNPLTCPSGCAVQSYPREANDLGPMVAPHLTIVWDGDKVDRIPVPVGPSSASSSRLISLTTESAAALVARFLQERGVTRRDLSLRIHFRDPVTETVRFMQSTLVSVCPMSSHVNVGHRRFPIFPGIPVNAIPTSMAASSGPGFAVDLHTSQAPIVACGCTSIRDLFSSKSSSTNSTTTTTVWLYAVKRTTTSASSGDNKNEKTVSKQSTFLSDAAWQPSVTQTPRGMAALLSSLYLFAHSVGLKDKAGEQKVIATAWALMRFPPAIRTLAILLLNKVPRPEEKAALAEAVYQALKEFSFSGPAAIRTKDGRRFETARILLAHIASAADAVSTASASERPAEEVSLICAVSRKRLRDPVRLENNTVVERAVAALLGPGGALYRPDHSQSAPVHSVPAITTTELTSLADLLPTIPALTAPSALVLRLHTIGWAPRELMTPLDTAARDFVAAIKRANRGDLVSQGPLELKSVSVVPPRIVVDQQGHLAVFTGRGCGTSRDVNFFRPTNGGDTEVDVNDVSHAQQSVIKAREAEDTWQVDSFGGITNISRPPDEAIVLCLDLSESMNAKSAVTSGSSTAVDEDEDMDEDVDEADDIVDECVKDMDEDEILEQAKEHLRALHSKCHHPWLALSDRSEPRGDELLDSLGVVASRRLLVLSDAKSRVAMTQVACFISAVADMKERLRLYLVELLDSPDTATIGPEPFSVPRKFIDFSTGELLVNPAHPRHAPPGVFVNASSLGELERGANWPMGHVVPSDLSGPKLKAAVEAWVAGKDLLPGVQLNAITVTFSDQGKISTWRLGKSTTTRTLYALAHRATSARFSSFTIRIKTSNKTIQESPTLTLGQVFKDGGAVVMTNIVLHERKPLTIEVPCTFFDSAQSLRMIVPRDSTVLTVLSYVAIWADNMPGFAIPEKMLWHGLRECGDGVSRGTPLTPDYALTYLEDIPFGLIKLDLRQYQQMSTGARRSRKESKHLTRLHLLKELFNVFLNRASSFDTTVSLVLGLVTFSDRASEDQELTPIFENFRRQLDHKEAGGDTAVYDALDSARRILTQYRPDLPSLRKRVIIVSDGEDTKSNTTAAEVCLALQRAKIVVDSVQVGPRSDPTLRAISVVTGGYRFSPNTSLGDALSIFDLETMLYSGERPARSEPKPKLVMSAFDLRGYQNLTRYPVDAITIDHFPPRKPHPRFEEPVKSASKITGAGGGDDRTKRIMREIAAVVADPHPNIDVYVVDGDMSFLKVVIEAPKDVKECPYSGGTFLLTCNLSAGYPREPPEVRFVTTIMHPNVSKQGKVCIAELGRLWASDITLKQIFSLVYGTLLTPDLDNPLELQASLKYYDDDGTYALAVAQATARHASKSRAEWKQELD